MVQGIERGFWKWSVFVEGTIATGNEKTRQAGATAAEKTIDWGDRGTDRPATID